MAELILMAYDECGDEVHIKDFQVLMEIYEDEDMLDAWKEIKERRAEIPSEWYGLHWIDRTAEKRWARQMAREFFF